MSGRRDGEHEVPDPAKLQSAVRLRGTCYGPHLRKPWRLLSSQSDCLEEDIAFEFLRDV